MPEFKIETAGPVFYYNSDDSTLLDERRVPVDLSGLSHFKGKTGVPAGQVSLDTPGGKVGQLKSLKIQLGLSCNYECSYCSQRFVPHAEATNRGDVEGFMQQLEGWFDGGTDGQGAGVQVEFWGGEPFVYWKTLKPLAEAVRKRYPNVVFWMPSNGSLLDDEKIDWLDDMGFAISISHDGPGHHVRGPDPFTDSKAGEAIMKLYRRLAPKGRFSFNSVMHKGNMSRAAVVDFFKKLTGSDDVSLGEGAFIDPYDEGGLESSLTGDDHKTFRNLAIQELAAGLVTPANSRLLDAKITGFIRSLVNGRPIENVGQKCGMDRSDKIAVDLKGNVLTCQNVSAAATAPNGRPHKIGHVSDLAGVKLDTATSWHHRPGCRACPVLHLCGGSCMFLEGNLWDAGCDNSFSDNVVFFAWAIELITGWRPLRIIGGRKDREDIWNPTAAKRKVITIKAA